MGENVYFQSNLEMRKKVNDKKYSLLFFPLSIISIPKSENRSPDIRGKSLTLFFKTWLPCFSQQTETVEKAHRKRKLYCSQLHLPFFLLFSALFLSYFPADFCFLAGMCKSDWRLKTLARFARWRMFITIAYFDLQPD